MAILAYIDAGSGSLLLQVLLAGALAVPFFFRRTITAAVRRVRGDEPQPTPRRPAEGEQSER